LVASVSRGRTAQLDWMFVRAVIDGVDPYAPVGETASRYGVPFEGDWPPPRLPAQLLLQLPWALVPQSIVPELGRAIAAAALVAVSWFLRPSWWWCLLAWPALSAVYYGNASAIVTLLLAVWFARRSGVALGVATALRAWPWFIGLCLFAAGRRREAVNAGLVFLGLNGLGLLLPGVTFAGAVDGLVGARVVENVSVNLTRGVPLWLATTIGVGVVAFVAWRPRFVALAVPYGLLLSPLVWFHYLTALAVVRVEEPGRVAIATRLSPRPMPSSSSRRASGTMAP
jgi:hypothetical protein